MIRVLRPGLLTTVQDLGRPGRQDSGVAVGGAMDAAALRIANLLVGNDEGAAAIEATLIGPALALEDDVLVALTGADFAATLDDRPVPPWRPFLARAGSTLSLGAAVAGARACIAVSGGIAVPVVLGGRGTDLRARIGGVDGRALAAGDRLPVGPPSTRALSRMARLRAGTGIAAWGAGRGVRPSYGAALRVVAGPERSAFHAAAVQGLAEAEFEVRPDSDRMGLRLHGPPLRPREPLEMVSSPVTAGTIQVPPGGDPLLLAADRQTTGGYPRLANVASVDLPLVGQAVPGARLRFRWIDHAAAEAALRERERDLRRLAVMLTLIDR